MSMNEMGSTYAKLLIEALLNVHALTNMYRVSGREETLKTAADWLPTLKHLMNCLERELTKEEEQEERKVYGPCGGADDEGRF